MASIGDDVADHFLNEGPFMRILASLIAVTLAPAAAAQTCTATIAQTEGPYYRTPNPETQWMRRGSDGPLFTLRGKVVDTNCNPIPWTWVALWHADPTGAYDNVAPFDVYRATFFTDANGEFTFYTIKPGLYPGRTRHAHIKVDAANTAVLTTQLYWPGEPQNSTDGIFNAALLMSVTTNPDGSSEGFYQFTLPVSGACTGATITSNPTSLSVQPGATATLTSGGAGSLPRTFRWYRNGLELQDGGRVSGATTATLTIATTVVADSGSYTCRSANSCGSQVSAPAILTVGTPNPADLDLNGVVDGGDLGIMLGSWGTCSACAADLDGDGTVGGADLGVLLSGWGGAA